MMIREQYSKQFEKGEVLPLQLVEQNAPFSRLNA